MNTLCWIRAFREEFARGCSGDSRSMITAMYHKLQAINIQLVFVDDLFLFSHKKTPNFNNPMVAECNGLIYSMTDDRLVSVPVPLCNTKLTIDDIHTLDAYDVYEIIDGTMLNVYYYSGEWRVATTNSIDARIQDISNQIMTTVSKPSGNISYADLLADALSLYPQFSYDALDKECSYNLVMYHHAVHLFKTTYTMRMWHINTVNVVSQQQVMVDIGIPRQEKVDTTIATIKHTNMNALNEHIMVPTNNPKFGYILRARDSSVSRVVANVTLYSTLFDAIRNMCYETAINGSVKKWNLNKYLYIACNAFMRGHQTKTNLFVVLFGEPGGILHDEYRRKITQVIERACQIVQGKPYPDDQLTDLVITSFINNLGPGQTPTKANQVRRFITNLVANTRNLFATYSMLLPFYEGTVQVQ